MTELATPKPVTSSGDPQFAELFETIAAKLQAGEPVDIEAYATEHPEFAERLRLLLPTVGVLAELGRSGVTCGAGLEGRETAELGTLGDFRIVREVGRGGMGVVYEAEQLSLRRRVALKVLPFAAAMDGRHLQRFKNEAQAAACLHHTNIVPVFGVGCERNVHYYAMQFIDGQPLSAVIQDLRRRKRAGAKDEPTLSVGQAANLPALAPPAEAPDTAVPVQGALSTKLSVTGPAYFQTVARLGEQAALGLDYAHQRGIVHRDIKPANLLLDADGTLWVTDFGLAQMRSDTRLTMTGDIVGTLRYMSPEQALAKRVVVDHRTDIYSLGATLYELLTLEPAVEGSDRQELLRRIAFEEPRPPRRLNKSIPADLETIVLKALEKNPAERYATAQELANDLQRVLKDEAIRARRPSSWQKTMRWARRRKAVVATAAAGVILALTVLAGSIGWIVRDQEARHRQIVEAVDRALDEGAKAQNARNWADARVAVSQAHSLLATGAGEAAQTQRAADLLAQLTMLVRLEEIRFQRFDVVKYDHFDREGTDASYSRAFRDYNIDVDALPVEEVIARLRRAPIVVELIAALDDWATALRREPQRSKFLLNIARQADPDQDPWRQRLRLALEQGESVERLTVETGEQALSPSTVLLLAFAFDSAPSKVSNAQSSKLAVAVLRKAQLQYPENFLISHMLARYLHVSAPPQLDEAVGFYRAAVALRSQSPGAWLNLGVALQDKGDTASAIAAYQKAIALKPDYAMAHYNIGNALSKGDLAGAIAAFQKAIALKPDYVEALSNLGHGLEEKGDLAGATAAYQKAIALNSKFAVTYSNLGNVLRQKGDLAGAIAACQKAIALEPDYAGSHNNLGLALQSQGEFRQALIAYRRGHELEKDPKWTLSLAQQIRACERYLELEDKLPDYISGKATPASAAEQIDFAELCVIKHMNHAAVHFFEAGFTAEPQLANELAKEYRYSAACVAALSGCGQGKDSATLDDKESVRLRGQALEWLRADLAAWGERIEKESDKVRPLVLKTLSYWQRDGDFSGVRDPDGLAKLPAAERDAWRDLWAEVAKTLERAGKVK